MEKQIIQKLKNRALIVLSTPSISDKYYKQYFQSILNFQLNFVREIIKAGEDDVLLYSEPKTLENIKNSYDVLDIKNNLRSYDFKDIWMRDFSEALNQSFEYPKTYENTQKSKVEFKNFYKKHNLELTQQELFLDGGNIVHNKTDSLIVTERFLEDNDLTYEAGKEVLKKLFSGFSYFAIIPYTDKVLGHADGEVCFASMTNNKRVIFMLKSNVDGKREKSIKKKQVNEIMSSIPDAEIVELETEFSDKSIKGFESAYGCYVNSLSTESCVYVPLFGGLYDSSTLELYKKYNQEKKVVGINCAEVSILGGTINCISWDVYGNNRKILLDSIEK